MVSYKELGLVNTREMFAKAMKGGYAVPAFNFNNMEQLQAIIKAAAEEKSPVILQVSKGARNYANATLLRYMAQGAVAYAKELGWEHPQICLHLDHGDSFELCKDCIDNGFSSVMIDGSHLPYEENVALTKKVVDYAHQFDVTVEGELGVLAGVEDEVSSDHHTYTDPAEVVDFATRTGCDSLAISIGTSHGAYKFTPEQCTRNAEGRLVPPPLAFDVLDGVMKELPGFPIVLHGSSSVPQEYVDIINKFGGKLPDEKYDLVVASLVLHHVANVPALLTSFASILAPGGVACIIELDDAGGKFHAHIDHYDGHDGFKRDEFEQSLRDAGFAEVQFHDVGKIEREDGEYSLFLANAFTS